MPGLPVADAAHGGQFGVQIGSLAQSFDFLHKSLRKHCVEAQRDARVQPLPVSGFQ